MRANMIGALLFAALLGCLPETTRLTDPDDVRPGFYAAPTGRPDGDGSVGRPWDLATALAHPSVVQPGDTIWLRGGSYRGTFVSRLTGTAGAPIIVRQYPGERAVLNRNGGTGSVLLVNGGNTTFWGFEVVDSLRNSSVQGGEGVTVYASGIRLINLVVHDVSGDGIGSWSSAEGIEIYGTIVYNVGWLGTDRGHGHSIYLQNRVNTKHVIDNVLFNSFGYGIHIYGSSNAFFSGFNIEGNAVFNSGGGPNIYLAGGTPAERITVRRNVVYRSPGVGGISLLLGCVAGTSNRDVVVEQNVLLRGQVPLFLCNWSTASVSNNLLYGTAALAIVEGSVAGYQWTGNAHFGDSTRLSWRYNDSSYAWREWKGVTGLGASDRIAGAAPATNVTVVRPNRYEPGRAHIIVYNASGVSSVAVDVSGVLQTGDDYELRNVEDLAGIPIIRGSYSGASLEVPLRAVPPPVLIGGGSVGARATGPEFQVFVLTKPTTQTRWSPR
jgi:hypothetical protein